MSLQARYKDLPVETAAPPAPTSPLRRRPMGAWGVIALLLPLLSCALFGAYFYVQANSKVQSDYYPYEWQASWISSPYAGNTGCFRKTLDITNPVQTAYLAVAADNYFDVDVNGKAPILFFNSALKHTFQIGSSQTSYSELGHPRHTKRAVIFNIGSLLRPGRNVITIRVLSDTGKPQLLAQGVINGIERGEVISDNSWRVSPVQQTVNRTPWTSRYFIDSDWKKAAVVGPAGDVPVDGDTGLFDTPLLGATITAHSDNWSATARFHKTITVPSTATGGWMRLVTDAPYDLLINGHAVHSTSMLDRYSEPLVDLRGETDALNRIQYGGEPTRVPSPRIGVFTETFLVQGLFHPGQNTLDVTLHSNALPGQSESPSFYLDGTLTDGQKPVDSFWTDSTWQAQVPSAGAAWTDADAIALPSHEFPHFISNHLPYKIDPTSLQRRDILLQGLLFFAAALAVCLVTAGLARLTGRSWWLLPALCKTFLTPGIVLFCGMCLQAVFAYSPQDQFFSSAAYARGLLWVAGAAWLVTCVATLLGGAPAPMDLGEPRLLLPRAPRWPGAAAFLSRYGFAAGVAVVMVAAEIVYSHALAASGFINDEYASLLAARGIVRHGVPIFEGSGIIYPRSSLFHYMLAAFVAVGYNAGHPEWTRLLAGFWTLATIPVVYLLGRELRGRWVGLCAAVLVAFAPYIVFYAREVRFYTQFMFFTTWMFYFLLQSVRNPQKDGYRAGVILCYIGAYLGQQIAFAAMPAAVLVIALSGQAKLWLRWRPLAWMGLAGLVMAADLYAYFKYCVTPLPFLDIDAIPLLALHTDNLELLPSMLLINYERSQLPLGVLFVLGLVYLAARRIGKRDATDEAAPAGSQITWHWWNFLYLLVVPTLLITTLVLPIPGSRYIVQLAPAVVLIACCLTAELAQVLGHWMRQATASPVPSWLTRTVLVVCVALLCVAAYRPARMWNTTSQITNRDDTGATRFVRDHRQPGDKMVFLGPQQGLLEMDQCDYYWRPNQGSLYMYMGKDGILRDRNSGAPVIDNVDKLRQVVMANPRVWLVMPADRLNGTPMGKFVTDNFSVAYESFGVVVCHWDSTSNHYSDHAQDDGYDQLNF